MLKIGDWVINSNANISKVIKDHSSFETEKTGQCVMTNSTNGCYISANQFEIWQPKVGEWCWKQTLFIRITKIENLNRDDGLLTYTFEVPALGEIWISSFIPEPFIGELPTQAKEEQ